MDEYIFQGLFERCKCILNGESKEIEKSKFNINTKMIKYWWKVFHSSKTKSELANLNAFDQKQIIIIELEHA